MEGLQISDSKINFLKINFPIFNSHFFRVLTISRDAVTYKYLLHLWKDLKTKWILIIFHRRYYAKIIKKSPSPGHHKNCPLLRCLRWGQCLVTTCQGRVSIVLVRSGGCQPMIGWEPHTGIIWTDIKIARPHLLMIGALIWFGPIKGICSEIRINCSEWIQMNCTETRLLTSCYTD